MLLLGPECVLGRSVSSGLMSGRSKLLLLFSDENDAPLCGFLLLTRKVSKNGKAIDLALDGTTDVTALQI